MASGEPIRFRCSRCKQLIGVVRSKAGTVITCPKCAANLVVPEPDDEPVTAPTAAPPPADAPSDTGATAEFFPDLGGSLGSTGTTGRPSDAVPLDALDLRLEDIQVEPGVRGLYPAQRPPRPYRPTPAPARPTSPASEPTPPVDVPEPEDISATVESRDAEPPLLPADILPVSAAPAAIDLPPLAIDVNEPDGRRARPVEAARMRDIVLPRSVVASWSLLVLMAVSFAFVAGLLAGHYVWRVH